MAIPEEILVVPGKSLFTRTQRNIYNFKKLQISV